MDANLHRNASTTSLSREAWLLSIFSFTQVKTAIINNSIPTQQYNIMEQNRWQEKMLALYQKVSIQSKHSVPGSGVQRAGGTYPPHTHGSGIPAKLLLDYVWGKQFPARTVHSLINHQTFSLSRAAAGRAG
jgi:hypothetical protein